MGTFYQYFRNKEQVFLELNDLILSRFFEKSRLLQAAEGDFEQRLKRAVDLLYSHIKHNFAFHSILGESELVERVTVFYYESIARYYRDFFRRESQGGAIRALDPNILAYSLIGICYFNSLDCWDAIGEKFSNEEIVDMITEFSLHGISGPSPWERPEDWDILSLPEPIPLRPEKSNNFSKGEETQRAILQAAEKVFSRHGFNRANIGEITREAGVAQGTFYIHFESKRHLIEGFVRYINYELRREIQRRITNMKDRRDKERGGVLAFYEFLQKHKEIYRVVPEFEKIGKDMSLWYYKKIAVGYIKGLEEGIRKREIRDMPPLFLALSLMGITHFIGLRWVVWGKNDQGINSSQLNQDVIEFILNGLKA